MGFATIKAGKLEDIPVYDVVIDLLRLIEAYHMRAPAWKIKKAIKLRDQGLTYAQIAKKVKGFSRKTIWKWLKDRRKEKNQSLTIEREIRGHYRWNQPAER